MADHLLSYRDMPITFRRSQLETFGLVEVFDFLNVERPFAAKESHLFLSARLRPSVMLFGLAFDQFALQPDSSLMSTQVNPFAIDSSVSTAAAPSPRFTSPPFG